MSITREQCRAARGLLGWSQAQLCAAANVAQATLANYEAGKRNPMPNNLAAIRTALEAAGITFLADGQAAVGDGVSFMPKDAK